MFDIKEREFNIPKPSFIDTLDKTICFLDFRMNRYDIKNGGRIIEYSLIKCSKTRMDIFHSIARPSYSLTNNKSVNIPDFVIDKIKIPFEDIMRSRNTFEIFLEMLEFMSDVDIVILNDYKWHVSLLKFYLIELDIDIPKFWIKDTQPFVKKHFPESLNEYKEENGFLRNYKNLLLLEVSGVKAFRERSYRDIPKHKYWNNLPIDKINRFYKRLIKHNKWLLKGRHKLPDALLPYVNSLPGMINVQASESTKE
jgi:DNA polymerase III epsilon subunit-like protein